MPLVRCPHCQALMQVESDDQLESYACMLCGGSLQAPRQEEPAANYHVEEAIERPHRTQEVQDFVDKVLRDAERDEAERRKPYKKQARPVGPILGYSLIGGGALLMLGAFCLGSSMMSTLIYGILFPFMMILTGVVCVKIR